MTDQLRIRGLDPRMLSPRRDLAHCMAGLLQETSARFARGAWPAVETYLINSGVRPDELVLVAETLLRLSHDARETSDPLERCLKDGGWFVVPEAAKIGYLAMLGSVVVCVHFAGVKHAKLNEDGPDISDPDVRRVIGKLQRELFPGPGRRFYLRCRAWLSRRFARSPIPQEEIDAANGSADRVADHRGSGNPVDL